MILVCKVLETVFSVSALKVNEPKVANPKITNPPAAELSTVGIEETNEEHDQTQENVNPLPTPTTSSGKP